MPSKKLKDLLWDEIKSSLSDAHIHCEEKNYIDLVCKDLEEIMAFTKAIEMVESKAKSVNHEYHN